MEEVLVDPQLPHIAAPPKRKRGHEEVPDSEGEDELERRNPKQPRIDNSPNVTFQPFVEEAVKGIPEQKLSLILKLRIGKAACARFAYVHPAIPAPPSSNSNDEDFFDTMEHKPPVQHTSPLQAPKRKRDQEEDPQDEETKKPPKKKLRIKGLSPNKKGISYDPPPAPSGSGDKRKRDVEIPDSQEEELELPPKKSQKIKLKFTSNSAAFQGRQNPPRGGGQAGGLVS